MLLQVVEQGRWSLKEEAEVREKRAVIRARRKEAVANQGAASQQVGLAPDDQLGVARAALVYVGQHEDQTSC